MRVATAAILAAFTAFLMLAGADLPAMGEPDAPAAVYVAANYMKRSLAETKTPNVVTAVLADYRGFDTLGETTVVLTAALACLLVLAGREPGRRGP